MELVGSRFPELTGWAQQRLIVGAEGNPLALLEFAGAIQDGHGLPDHTAGSAPLSQRLRDIYAPRILALPAATRSVLLLAALHGAGEAAVLARSRNRRVECARLCRTRPVDIGQRGQWAGCVPPSRDSVDCRGIRQRHRTTPCPSRAGRRPDRSAGTAAWHLADATVEPDENVAELLESTAHEILRKGDAVSAADALGRASDLSPHLIDRSRRLIAAASLRAEVTGELRSASELLGSALRGQPALTDSLLAAVATAQLLINAEGDVETAHHLLVTAIDKYAERHDSTDETLIDALHALLMVCWMAGRPDMWTQFDVAMARLTSPAPPVLLMCRSTFGDPARDALPVADQLDMVTGNINTSSTP